MTRRRPLLALVLALVPAGIGCGSEDGGGRAKADRWVPGPRPHEADRQRQLYARGVGLVPALGVSGGGGREELLRYEPAR